MKPNAKCEICEKDVYRKPYQLAHYKHVFCSRECQYSTVKRITCPVCRKEFSDENKKRICCSKKCSNIHRRGIKYKKGSKRDAKNRKLWMLQDFFGHIDSCMIEGCEYSKCYQVHRFVAGKHGGKYEIGNMFAICPNHHAEIHAGITVVEKVDDKTLRIRK